jgi:polysaccharide deacetylase 2 family uncharacterized protein YibQ
MSHGPGHHTQPAPKSALYFAIWFSALASLATLALVLLAQFLISRPVDLVAQTDELAALALATLENHRIPPDAITALEPELRENEGGVWSHRRFDVELPPAMDQQGVSSALRRALLPFNVSMREGSDEGRLSLEFWVGDHDFATVRFVAPQEQAAPMIDLRPSAGRIIQAVETLLTGAGVPASSLRKSPETEMLDDEARWLFCAMAFPLPGALTAGELRGNIETRLAERDVRVASEAGPFGTSLITVFFSGKRCVELTCEPAGMATPPPARPDSPAEAPLTDATAMPPVPGPGIPEQNTPSLTSQVLPLPPEETLPMDRMVEGEPEAPGPREAPAVPAGPARVAIILDDGGYGGAHSDQILETLDPALTLAILPNTPFGAETATRGAARGFEIMLHMPMETHANGANVFPGEITTAMTAEEIQANTRAAIAQIPGLKGINNHTGSKFTSDAEAMRSCLAVVKELGLYFVDSRTIAASRAYDEARALGIPAARRDVFLDNEKDHAYIEQQLDELIALAKSRGSAIGIGHFRPDSVAVLAEYLPTLADKGVTLVHASELLQ